MTMQLEGALSRLETKIHNDLAETRDRLNQLEQGRSAPRPEPMASSLGAQFLKAFTENRELFGKTGSLRLQLKGASDPVTTSSGRSLIAGGVGAIGPNALGLQRALTIGSAPSTTAAEYSRFTGSTGAAAVQAAQGDGKAPLRPDHSLINQNSVTIAGFSKMSRQALNDSAELQKAVDVTLARSVALALDSALTGGCAGFVGGFEGLATAHVSAVYDSLADAVSEAVAAMQAAGFAPDRVVMQPGDWLGITLARGQLNDHYLGGAYLSSQAAELRGLQVILSPSVTAGKALVLDRQHSELLVVDGFSIEMAYDSDDFTKNLITILGETRVIPIFRTVGSARLVTPKAA